MISVHSPMRCFLAIPLPKSVITSLANGISLLRSNYFQHARWVKPDQIHLTLKFLGEIEKIRIAEIKSTMDNWNAHFHSYILSPEGFGAFPNLRFPHVLWVGIKDPTGGHANLVNHLENDMSKIGFPRELKNSVPHLTLARIRDPGHSRTLPENVIIFDNMPVFSVNSIQLIESKLSAGGARYQVLHQVYLR